MCRMHFLLEECSAFWSLRPALIAALPGIVRDGGRRAQVRPGGGAHDAVPGLAPHAPRAQVRAAKNPRDGRTMRMHACDFRRHSATLSISQYSTLSRDAVCRTPRQVRRLWPSSRGAAAGGAEAARAGRRPPGVRARDPARRPAGGARLALSVGRNFGVPGLRLFLDGSH